MYKEKSFLAIIPARSGSKGLKHKNIKLLNGKPLMAYTIETAINSQVFDEIIVSTDSLEYAEIAKEYGASVPFMRSDELAQDTSTSIDVILEVLKNLEQQGKIYDYVALLQPTSPLRSAEDIEECAQRIIDLCADSIVSMCECEHPMEWCISFEDEDKSLRNFATQLIGRRQEQKQSYRLNGAIYLASTVFFLENKTMYGEKSYAYIMDRERSIDIDNIYDFKCAETLLKDLENM